ncbi:hypothetical protein LG634_15620 [Streptomyces bambusae]|uniref:hypothetical protein n=1 Tax=Streptomyces bambusae TaxID=1550616 RepID=UPI001CFEE9B3|nr:hypothetical protein [Streptomyces bambusae]MCB5166258.1 hypothetical protein [Streptomyces bambusae]
MRMRTLAATALVCATLGGLTACGSSDRPAKDPESKGSASAKAPEATKPADPFADLSGPQIHEKAYAATTAAQSMRLKGKVRTDGKDVGMDLALNLKGECSGTVTLGGTGTAEIIKSSEVIYYKGDAKLYRSQAKDMPKNQADAMVAMLADRWLKMKASSAEARQSAQMCDLEKLLASFGKSSPVARKGAPATVDGRQALTVTAPSEDGLETYYVATQGEPYLLRATKDGKEPGDITFSDYNKAVDLTPPADKDVIDADKLKRTGKAA